MNSNPSAILSPVPAERGAMGSSVDFKIVIPARYASNRFPGKLLKEICGKPMIQHVWERGCEAGASEILIATDDVRIQHAAEAFGAEVLMTSAEHESGSDRIAEVTNTRRWSDDAIVVNLQGDEPLTPAHILTQVATDLDLHKEADMTTLCAKIDNYRDLDDPNIVKVVHDNRGYALYFSRAPIPFIRDRDPEARPTYALRHIGIYGYRVEFLKRYTTMSMGRLEEIECLEQLRALRHGAKIYVSHTVESPEPGVDVPEDLERIATIMGEARHAC